MTSRRAFALIEVIIVLIILSVLASIAVGTVRNAKAKAYVAVMQSDLERLRTTEESYFVENHRYTLDLGALGFHATTGVSIDLTSVNDTAGYSAVATHANLPRGKCGVFVGPEAVRSPSGVTMCTQAPGGSFASGVSGTSK